MLVILIVMPHLDAEQELGRPQWDLKKYLFVTDGHGLEATDIATLTLPSYHIPIPQRLVVTEPQLRLMMTVYHDITRFPDNVWSEAIARTIDLWVTSL